MSVPFSDLTVSVIIPTYNYAHFISDAIESVLTQENFGGTLELIVVDDGSTDATREVVARYGNRVEYIYQENQGKAKATQTGINKATGKYIFNLDADDFYTPTRIAEAVAIFEKDPAVVHIGHPNEIEITETSARHIEAVPLALLNRMLPGKALIREFYLNRFFFGGGSTFAVRAAVMKKFVIPTGVDMYTDEFLLIFAANEGNSFLIDHPLTIGRSHGSNFSRFSQSQEVIRRKQERLMQSSDALHEAVQAHDFEPFTKKLMDFNHPGAGAGV